MALARDAEGQTLWRVSLADLDQSASFSSVPGLDRTSPLSGRSA
ncbi:MAG: HutD family protein [Dermatophilaceae bacterium]|nr:HutD family protein [Dermatophilaceae bacterium]